LTKKRILEEIELLKRHLEQEEADSAFVERHALAILELSRELPTGPQRVRLSHNLPIYQSWSG
jgi:predicted transcriptional regulator